MREEITKHVIEHLIFFSQFSSYDVKYYIKFTIFVFGVFWCVCTGTCLCVCFETYQNQPRQFNYKTFNTHFRGKQYIALWLVWKLKIIHPYSCLAICPVSPHTWCWPSSYLSPTPLPPHSHSLRKGVSWGHATWDMGESQESMGWP